jgi:hypothetical protein
MHQSRNGSAENCPFGQSQTTPVTGVFFLDWNYDGSIKMIPLKSYAGFKKSQEWKSSEK